MRAFLSGPILWPHIGTRILVAALVTPLVLALAIVFVPAALFRYALTGRRPDDLRPPWVDRVEERVTKLDRQATAIRAALDRAGTRVH